jgi:hypothetical protein
MRYHAHFGELPLGAFEHCGDKKIKPQGGGGIPIVSDVVDIGGDIVEDVGGFVGDAVEDVGGFVGDTVSSIGNTAGAFLEDPLGFTENLGKNLLDNPEKIALLVAAYYSPEILAQLAPEVATNLALSAEFAAADAAGLAAQGLTESQIAQTLAMSGVDAFVAADAAALAASGLSQSAIAQNLAATGLQAYQASQAAGFPVIGDQPGDFPMEGSYGTPTAPGVKEATQKLLDYNAAYATGGTGFKDVLKATDQAMNLLSSPQQVPNPQNAQQGQQLPFGVDYSGLLGLLQQKAKRPDILSLLG